MLVELHDAVTAHRGLRGPLGRLVSWALLSSSFLACRDTLEPTEPSQALTPSATSDGHTLLSLPFDNDLAAADGATPTRGGRRDLGERRGRIRRPGRQFRCS